MKSCRLAIEHQDFDVAVDEPGAYRIWRNAVDARISEPDAGHSQSKCQHRGQPVAKNWDDYIDRGHVAIVEKLELEDAACDYYEVIQRQLTKW